MVRTRSSGFTLLELLVAVVLVAILASLAIPSYSAYITRGQRAAAKVALEQAAQFLERTYTTSGCYDYGTAADCSAQGGVSAVSLPNGLAFAPNDGPATYALTIQQPPASQAFTVIATPCGTAGTCTGSKASFTDPDCGILLLDNTGQKGINVGGTADFTSAQAVTCWQR